MAGKATNNDTADMERSFIRALLTADTEKVSQILAERPELAVKSCLKKDIRAVYCVLESESVQKYNGIAHVVHRPYYDANNGYRYKQGYYSNVSATECPQEIEITQKYWFECGIFDMARQKESMKPIQFCSTPAHKKIVELLIKCGARIDDRTFYRDKNGDLISEPTLLYDVLASFPAPGISLNGIREYAEYIKWLISQGASMSFPYYQQRDSWRTLYDKYYERVVDTYAVRAAAKLRLFDGSDDKISQTKNICGSIDILADLTEYIFKDIDKGKYIPYDACALYTTKPVAARSHALQKTRFLKFAEVLNAVENDIAACRSVPEGVYDRLIQLILSPVEKLLLQFSKTELRYICQNNTWYQNMAVTVMKRVSPDSGWQKLWNMLNKHVGADGLYISDTPISDCIAGWIRHIMSGNICSNVPDDVLGKIEAFESILGHISEEDRNRLWPIIVDGYYFLYEDRKELLSKNGGRNKMANAVKQKQETLEALCSLADKYGADINRRNPYTGRTSVHTLCDNISEDYSLTKKNKYITSEEKADILACAVRVTAELLEKLEHYGADLSIKDDEGETPLDLFPRNFRNSIINCMEYMDNEKSALIEAEDLFVR